MSEILIPRIFHQVWINKKQPELPEPFARYRDTWLENHPGWEYKLWNLENLDFPLVNEDLLGSLPAFVYYSDLLRLEVVHHYGGVYLDTDMECYRNIESLLAGVETFFVAEGGDEWIDQAYTNPVVASFFGSKAKTSLLSLILSHFPKTFHFRSPVEVTGPIFVQDTILRYGSFRDLTVFASPLFHPFSAINKKKYDNSLNNAEFFPHAYGAHHWTNQWMFPQPLASPPEESKINNTENQLEKKIQASHNTKLPLTQENLFKTSWESKNPSFPNISFRGSSQLNLWCGLIRAKMTKKIHPFWFARKEIVFLIGSYKIENGNRICLESSDFYDFPKQEIIKICYEVKLYNDCMVWKLTSIDLKGLIKKIPRKIIWRRKPERWNPKTIFMEKI